MKVFKYFLVVNLLLVGRVTVLAQRVVTNPHDFSTQTWDLNERCNPCHVFNADESPNEANDFLISYERDSLSSADSVYLSSTSKLCFTCHDGSVASFSHTREVDDFNRDSFTMNDHPVSVVYKTEENGRTKLYDPNTTMSGMGGTISDDMLKNGRVECTSCHNAHFSTEKIACGSCPPVLFKQGTSDGSTSLWMENNRSALCLVCHKL